MNGEIDSYVVDLEQSFRQVEPPRLQQSIKGDRLPQWAANGAVPTNLSGSGLGNAANVLHATAKQSHLIQQNHSKKTEIFYTELKRRNVFRAGVAYIVAAWLGAQVADILCDGFGAPDWIMKTALISLALGFPIALIISWYVEITANGVIWDSSIEKVETITRQKGRTMDFLIIAVLTVVIGFLLAK